MQSMSKPSIIDQQNDSITVKFVVFRGGSPQELISDTRRSLHGISDTIASMPLQVGRRFSEEVEFTFFPVGHGVSNEEIEAEFAKRGLVQDLEAQFGYNADHPEFANDHPNGAIWKDAKGRWCFAHFNRYEDKLHCTDNRYQVVIWTDCYDWRSGTCWFGGRKV